MEQNNNKRLDDLFKQAKNEPAKKSFEETKANFLNSTSVASKVAKGGKLTQFTNFKLILMITTIAAITIGAVLFFNNSSDTNTKEEVISENIEYSVTDSALIVEEYEKVVNEYFEKVTALSPQLIEVNTNKRKLNKRKLKGVDKSWFLNESETMDENIQETAETYSFPKLNEDQWKAHQKQITWMFGKVKKNKTKMVGKSGRTLWSQTDPERFKFIPMGFYLRHEDTVSIQALYMKETEVTNIEYRTFLFELLRQNRKEEFLKAKPDQTRWVKDYKSDFNKPMQLNYFSHPAYDYYPAVGMSRKGAEMYCKWFTEGLAKASGGHKVNNVRLPTNYEWEWAARGGLENVPYPWGGSYLRNSEGCFLANFKPGKKASDEASLCSSHLKRKKNIKDGYSADGAFHTAKVNSYNPNDFGLYCMSGNVAEMVTDENNEPATKGGSWSSIGQELQIVEGNDRFKGLIKPSSDVGFRPVITYLGRAEERVALLKVNQGKTLPTLTLKEITENNKRKKMISRIGGKLEPFGFLNIPEGEMNLNGKKVKQNSFYIKQAEVSNLHYKTFLFDLIIQRRYDEFVIAKPDENKWEERKGVNGNDLTEKYFSDDLYNDYPVVNISREGAIMYCKWLSNEMNKGDNKKLKGITIKMTIPTKNEWIYAAKGGEENIYGWDLETLQNEVGCFLANFKYQKTQDQLPLTECEVKNRNASTTSGLMLGYESFTVIVNAYNPNKFGLYCMSGNVAEMVIDENNKPATKGGSWSSIGQELQIVDGKDRFKGITTPNINIGFRPVITIVND